MTNDRISEDEYLKSVGTIIHSSSMADIFMYFAFERLVHYDEQIARAIYFSLDSFNAKRSMLSRVAALTCNKAQLQAIKTIINANTKANRYRRQFAHLAYNVGELGVKQLTPKNLERPSQPVNRKELDHLIFKLSEAMLDAAFALEKLGEPLEPPD